MQEAELKAEVLQSVKEHFKQPRPQEDRHDIFGKNVANVLRDVLPPQRILAEKFINDVLFHAQMGTLTTFHRLTEDTRPLLPQHQEIPPSQTARSSYYVPTTIPQYSQGSPVMPQYSQRPPLLPQYSQGHQVYQHLTTHSASVPNLLPLPNEHSTDAGGLIDDVQQI